MASGYIGKISAVVTANTSDLSKKLRGSIQDWNKFGSSINSSLNKASTDAVKSLEKIFTPVQRLERQLKAALSSPLNIRTEEQANQIRRLTSAAEQINKPLENAASSFNRLSLEVQANFAPALGRAQRQAELLFQLIERGRSPSEKSFAAVQSRVEQTTQAISRLAQAQQLASRSLTGTELQFKNPALFEVLSQSAAATQRAGALPSSRLQDGAIAGQVEALQQYQQAAIRAQAQLESLSLDPRVDPSVIESQTRRLNNLIETARRAQQALAAATSTPQDDTEALIERERRAKQTEEQISSAEDRRRVEKAKADNEEIERLIEKERRGKQVEEEISSAEQERAKKKKRTDDEEIQALIKREQAAKRLAAAADQQQAKEAQIVNRRKQIADEFASRSSAEGLALDLDSSELSSAQAKLNVFRQTLSKLSSSEAAAAEAAISRLGSAVSSAMANGTIRTAETRREIERLTQEAVEASAAAANINPRSLSRSVSRAGDVGRRGFDNVSLALNQAAFAVDDFLSSTGGLEFRIRAVQNNLTQLGFILGGTTGLFVSLGIAIAGQATIALVNFLNEGRKTEDMVKALNDSLSRQKEVAGEVGSAFEEIGRELGSDVFSDAANDAQRLAERLEQLTDAFKRLREERIAQSSVTAQEAQANINSLDRRLQAEEDPGVRILLQRQLLEARRRAAEVTAGLSEPTTVLGGVARFREAITPLEEFRGSGTQQRLTREQIGRNIDSVISNADIRDLAGLRAAVEARLEETAALVNTGEGAFRVFRGASSDVAADEVGNLQSLLTSIQGFQQAGEALSNAANVSDSIRKSLAEARDRIDEFGEGIESAGRFSDAIDAQGRILEQAVSSISAAFGRLERLEISPEQFRDALNSAAASVDAEAVARAQLIRDIEATFNEEERLRLDGAKTAQEADAKRAGADAKRAEEDLKASTERGRQLLLGESGRRAEQIAASIGDIRNAGGGQRQIAGFLAEQARQIAPALFAAGDQILNAVATGPNRAALSASDITTQQGTSELNRLLRGDDPAREQNIVELRKQTAELAGLRQDLRNLQVAD